MRTAPRKPNRTRPQAEPQTRVHVPVPRPFGLVSAVGRTLATTALLVAMLLGIGSWRGGERFWSGLRMILFPPPPAPQVDVRSIVIQELRGASELTTAVFAMEAVVPTRSDRTLAGYVVGSTNLLYIAYGEVRAGVDLSQVDAEDVRLDEAAITITLPPPRILSSNLDVNRSDVYDYDRGFLGLGPDNAPELQAIAQQRALSKIVEAACQQGVLQEASGRAETTVRQLLTTAGFETVEVITQAPAEPCVAPASEPSPAQAPDAG